ncbi:hypothetical protein [Allosphingosinicella sp.]|uniref:hypothetical protein n=1 Tax=Allosphingosinicella sp. TaxID=2823234 RepID=UPI002EDD672A
MRAFILMAAVAVMATGAASAADPVGAPGANSRDERVCRQRAKTGTRFATRVCHTRAQWERITEENRRAAAEMINKPMIETRRE